MCDQFLSNREDFNCSSLTPTIFIPAKSVSTRIPYKNMAMLGDKPLIAWTLEACRYWGPANIVVATDDARIADYAKAYGASIYSLTEDDLQDKRTVSQLWKSFVQNQIGPQILMHITSPFRFKADIVAAWEMFCSGKYEIIMTVSEDRRVPLWEEGESRMVNLSQNRKPKYLDDGGWYIADAEYIKRCRFYEDGKVGLFPVNAVAGIDIDDPIDLEIARCIASSKPDWWNRQTEFICD